MATLLAVKAKSENPFALSDDHHDALAKDPLITSFPTGSIFGETNNATTPATGFATGATTSSVPAAATAPNISAPTATANSSAASSFGSSPSTSTVNIIQNQAESLKSGGGAMSEGGSSTVALDKESEHWVNSKWRPAMGWLYMATCLTDFILFPIFWSILQAAMHGQVTSQWQPITLQGAGLYHIAMGAVLGIAAYGRTKEKVAGAN